MPDFNFDEILASEQADDAKFELIELLIACPSLNSPADQRNVVNSLPQKIKTAIQYGQSDSAKTQMFAIYQSCIATSGGFKAIYNALRFFDGHTTQFKAVEAFFGQFVTPTPPVVASNSTPLTNSFEALRNKFNTACDNKDWSIAIRSGEKLIAEHFDAKIVRKLAHAYYQNGLELQEINQLNKALKNFQNAITLTPDNGDYFFKIGEIYETLQHLDQAYIHYERAKRLNKLEAAIALNRVYIIRRNIQLEDTDVQIARKAAEELLQETIETMHLLENGALISRYITYAEYQLFLDSLIEKEEYWQPLHWATTRFKPGNALTPIAGLRDWQADGFCDWLSEQRRHKFRLPMATEVKSNIVKPYNLTAWCYSNGNYFLEELNKSTKNTIRLRLRNLLGKPTEFAEPSNLDPLHDPIIESATKIALDLTFDLAFDLDFNLACTLALNLAEQSKFVQVSFDLRMKDYHMAMKGVRSILQSLVPEVTHWRATLLQDMIAALVAYHAQNIFAVQLARQKYAMHFAEYAYRGLDMREQKEDIKLDKEKQRAIDLYFWARVQIERRNDPTFPVWEGLRIVREA